MEINERSSGILLHPTSLPGRYGIGDLGKQSYDFIDFLKRAKQKLWQILPIGHTSFGDSPYQSFSTFAGNPLLISPDELIKEGYLSPGDISLINFPANRVSYGEVIKYKTDIYKKAYMAFKEKASKKQLSAYKKFCGDNSSWLDDYSLFISLKNYFIEERRFAYETEEYNEYKKNNLKTLGKDGVNDYFYGAVWNSWPQDIKDKEKQAIEKWNKTLGDDIGFYKFLQYEFFRQWLNLKQYANQNGISVIGDIPIYVAADSADTWSNCVLFEINKKGFPDEVAGVPPDYFSKTGQLWGNPIYKWDEHRKTGYEWWIARIKSVLSLVDIVRIDHFRGFDTYWAVPYGEETAVNGKWKKGPGEEIFRRIEEALGDLPIIAEDLGDLNEDVIMLRKSLGFPGMKILQFAFDSNKSDYLPHNYKDSNTVVYTGTHDNDTTVGWYNSTNDNVRDYYRRYLNVSGDDVAWDLIKLAYCSCADTVIIPVQDLMSLDSGSRMNTPSVAAGNWQFRYSEGMLNEHIAERLSYLADLYNRW